MLKTKSDYLFKRFVKVGNTIVPKSFCFYSDGEKWWRLNHQYHNENGPAIEYQDGTKQWYLYGQIHNLAGPAHSEANGYTEWWISGTRYHTHEEYKTAVENYRMINKKMITRE